MMSRAGTAARSADSTAPSMTLDARRTASRTGDLKLLQPFIVAEVDRVGIGADARLDGGDRAANARTPGATPEPM